MGTTSLIFLPATLFIVFLLFDTIIVSLDRTWRHVCSLNRCNHLMIAYVCIRSFDFKEKRFEKRNQKPMTDPVTRGAISQLYQRNCTLTPILQIVDIKLLPSSVQGGPDRYRYELSLRLSTAPSSSVLFVLCLSLMGRTMNFAHFGNGCSPSLARSCACSFQLRSSGSFTHASHL